MSRAALLLRALRNALHGARGDRAPLADELGSQVNMFVGPGRSPPRTSGGLEHQAYLEHLRREGFDLRAPHYRGEYGPHVGRDDPFEPAIDVNGEVNTRGIFLSPRPQVADAYTRLIDWSGNGAAKFFGLRERGPGANIARFYTRGRYTTRKRFMAPLDQGGFGGAGDARNAHALAIERARAAGFAGYDGQVQAPRIMGVSPDMLGLLPERYVFPDTDGVMRNTVSGFGRAPPRVAQGTEGTSAWQTLPIETRHDLAVLRADTAPSADVILYRRQLDDLAPDLTVEKVRLRDIPGVDLEDQARVNRYARRTTPAPPIIVFRHSDGTLGLLNGNHRRAVQEARGADTIPAVVLTESDVGMFPGINFRRPTMANQRHSPPSPAPPRVVQGSEASGSEQQAYLNRLRRALRAALFEGDDG